MLIDELFSDDGDDNIETEVGLDATAQLENLALDLLSQLCRAGASSSKSGDGGTSGSDEETNAEPSSSRPCIQLEMVDRAKTNPATGSYGVKFLTFPKKSSTGSAKPLAQLFKVVNLVHEAIVDDVPATKRDIYYRDVPLFKTQKTVDTIIDDIAASAKLERADLNVRATSKGVFCGSVFSITLTTGELIYGNDSEGSLIPVGEDIETFNVDNDIVWVLIVEKDAVFQTLCNLKASNHPLLPGKGLIITGKGYPDIATRHLVKTLCDFLPRTVPILVLVDGDPYGLDILSVYKFGSSRLRHENDKLAASQVQWMGILSSELAQLGIDKDALISITQHDEKKALSMLQRPREIMPSKWRKELMHMLHNRRKAEIEILSSSKYAQSFSQESSPSFSSSDHAKSRSPLLDYLALKLSQFVSSAQMRCSP